MAQEYRLKQKYPEIQEQLDHNLNGNKEYNQQDFSGMGRVYLDKNVKAIGGLIKNWLEQSMLNRANTVYVIQYDFELNGTINIPSGCVLQFDGGSLNGGVLVGNNSLLVSEPKLRCRIGGTFKNITYRSNWFHVIDGDLLYDLGVVNAKSRLVLDSDVLMTASVNNNIITHVDIDGCGHTITNCDFLKVVGDVALKNVNFVYSLSGNPSQDNVVFKYPYDDSEQYLNMPTINYNVENISVDGGGFLDKFLDFKFPSGKIYGGKCYFVVKKSKFTNILSIVFRVSPPIDTKAYINENVFYRIGHEGEIYDGSKRNSVEALWLGNGGRDGDENVLHGVTYAEINNNYFDKIVSPYYWGNDARELHAILCYGENINVVGNTMKNLSSSFDEVTDCGTDAEILYIKGSKCVVDGNYIENGSGSGSDASITMKVKEEKESKIVNNTILATAYPQTLLMLGGTDHVVSNNLFRTYIPEGKDFVFPDTAKQGDESIIDYRGAQIVLTNDVDLDGVTVFSDNIVEVINVKYKAPEGGDVEKARVKHLCLHIYSGDSTQHTKHVYQIKNNNFTISNCELTSGVIDSSCENVKFVGNKVTFDSITDCVRLFTFGMGSGKKDGETIIPPVPKNGIEIVDNAIFAKNCVSGTFLYGNNGVPEEYEYTKILGNQIKLHDTIISGFLVRADSLSLKENFIKFQFSNGFTPKYSKKLVESITQDNEGYIQIKGEYVKNELIGILVNASNFELTDIGDYNLLPVNPPYGFVFTDLITNCVLRYNGNKWSAVTSLFGELDYWKHYSDFLEPGTEVFSKSISSTDIIRSQFCNKGTGELLLYLRNVPDEPYVIGERNLETLPEGKYVFIDFVGSGSTPLAYLGFSTSNVQGEVDGPIYNGDAFIYLPSTDYNYIHIWTTSEKERAVAKYKIYSATYVWKTEYNVETIKFGEGDPEIYYDQNGLLAHGSVALRELNVATLDLTTYVPIDNVIVYYDPASPKTIMADFDQLYSSIKLKNFDQSSDVSVMKIVVFSRFFNRELLFKF